MSTLILPAVQLALETRQRRSIVNRMDRTVPTAGLAIAVSNAKTQYTTATHRPVGPCNTFNCHGLTFGSRRTWISGSQEIEDILVQDDYDPIPFGNVLAGDIAIYRKDGMIEHSGIVVEKDGLHHKILSKWGNMHEAIHFPLDCPYNDMQVSYYRISR